jgi:hypothetical protein
MNAGAIFVIVAFLQSAEPSLQLILVTNMASGGECRLQLNRLGFERQ